HDLFEPRLDIEMDVFQFAPEDEYPGLDLLFDRVQTGKDRIAVCAADDLVCCQHPRVSPRTRDILGRQPFVEIDGGRYVLHRGGGPAFEASAPHLVRAHRKLTMQSRSIAIAAALGAVVLVAVLYGIRTFSVHA